MHVRKRALRLLSAVALVTFALPLAVNGATPVNAQTTGSQPSASIADVASVSPAVAINPIGQEHTVAFTCGAQSFAGTGTAVAATGTAFVAAGCYNVTASVTDITSGAATTFDSALCGGVAASGGSGTVNCSSTRSPICPVGTVAATGTALTTTTPCVASSTSTASTPDVSNNVVVTINPGAPHAYIIDFTGYTPTTAAGSCPAGTTLVTGVTLSVTTGTSTTPTLVGPVNACRFVVEAQKKYAEVTSIVLTPVNACGGTLTFAEGLKSFFGPPCVVNVVVTGTVILKTGITCGNGTEPVTGTAAPSEFGPAATYQCANGTLSVVGVSGPAAGQTSLAGVRLAPAAGTGVGSFTTSGTLGSLCAGTTNTSSTTVFVTTISGINTTTGTASLCPTGPGAASLQLCLVGPDGTANTLPNNQPPLCSNTITANFTVRTERVVPQIRWSGEKIALTKCFGIGLANSPIEFVLKSTGAPLNATLIPASLGSTGQGSQGPTSPASSTTIWTTTDNNGCATVLGLADGEGTMQVDAAIFNNSAAGSAAGTPLVNEHVFEVFYLKFDHVNLENITFQTYTVAQALQPYLGFLSKTPALNGGSAANASFKLPSPPGTGNIAGTGTFGIPLCAPDFVRAMVHGYFEMPGDPSGRPAAQVAIGGASSQTGSAGSYVLPAGRWVLPEDWPLLATFAGFSGSSPLDITPSSVFAWDLNSGWVYNPTGETPVVCGVAAGVAGTNGLLLGGLSTPTPQTFGNIPVPANANVGPCFGQDQTMVGGTTFYATAAGSLSSTQLTTYGTNTGLGCLDDFTAGFGPFDPTRACTSPFPLTFSPAGSSVIGVGATDCGAGISACLIPTQEDSTYLPNGTLNQWDAPMPPAQISFGITSGPGFLGQVSKTNLYQIRFDAGTSTCPTGYTLYTGTNTCQLELDPNPFYAEAIPASPFIPNVDNNHGYLWNSFNFSAGTTTVVSSTPAFTGVGLGGFVAGQSTQVSFVTAVAGTCPALSVTVTASTATTGATCTVSGGVNLLPAGTGSATPNAIVVADGRGFLPNQTIEVYSNATGAVLGTLTVTAVLPSPRTVNGISYPNAVELQFAAPTFALTAAGGLTAISTLFGLPVPGAGAFTVGQQLTIGNPSGTQATSTVAAIDTTNNIVYVTDAELIARQLGDCLLSRTPVGSGLGEGGGTSFLSCEPGLTVGGTASQALVTPGTVINSGPVGANDEGALNLYPFWQWIPTPPTSGGTPTTATVYSDNHGEAVVSLNTTVQSQIAPSSTGTCPAGYTPVTAGNPPVTTGCILQLGSLGTMNIGNGSLGTVKSALAAFSASSPGCIQTFPSGTFAALTGVTVGATGPAPGQICVNSFGAVEFGANATLGTTSIVAVADYPYIREHAQIASPTLTKVFQSGFAKTLSVSAGTAAPANTTAYTVTVTATDVCGNPIINEPVNVYAISATNAVVLAPLNVGAILQSSSNAASVQLVPSGANAGTGTFTLEVLNTAIGTQGLVVKAVFPAEGIERLVTVISGTPTGQNTTVVYSPGWQQVGGPSGSNFSTVEALFAYDTGSGKYTNATSVAGNISSAAPTCTGYWGYFAAAMTVTLPVTSKSGDTAACTLAAGYNLVGNPFGSNAKLPSGVTAYHWNGTSYDVVSQIGIGQSVWVFNDGTLNSLTLTAL